MSDSTNRDEFDPFEYAEQLGHTDELGKGDYSDPNVVRAESGRGGLTRRQLLVRGGLGAAALSTAGGLSAAAGAPRSAAGTSGAYTGTLNVISLGVEWPTGAQAVAEK